MGARVKRARTRLGRLQPRPGPAALFPRRPIPPPPCSHDALFPNRPVPQPPCSHTALLRPDPLRSCTLYIGDRVAAGRVCGGQRAREQRWSRARPGARAQGQPGRLGDHGRHQLQGPGMPLPRPAPTCPTPPRPNLPCPASPPNLSCRAPMFLGSDVRHARAGGRHGRAQRRPHHQHRLRRRLVPVPGRQHLRRHERCASQNSPRGTHARGG